MNFPKIKRAELQYVQSFKTANIGEGFGIVQKIDLRNERKSRAAWARALAEKLKDAKEEIEDPVVTGCDEEGLHELKVIIMELFKQAELDEGMK